MRKYFLIMKRECLYIWRDRTLRNIIIFGPILGILLFAYVYRMQVIQDIPTAIVDLDHSSQSCELREDLEAAQNLKVTDYPADYSDMETMIENGDIVVGIVIPEGYGKNITLKRQTRILAVIDGSNITFATPASSAIMEVTQTISAETGIKILVGMGMTLDEAQNAYQSIEFRQEAWYNPTLNYAYFLILALALNIWQQCCTLTAAVNVIGEIGMSSWLQIKASGISKLALFGSKSIVHLTIFMLLVLPVYFLAFVVFKLPLHCNFGLLLLFTFVFSIAIHSIGTMMSSLTNNAVDSSRLGMMVALPSFVLCGYTWPLEAMPAVIQKAAWILPQTWFFQGYNFMVFKGAEFNMLSYYFVAMLIIALVCYGISIIAVSWLER